MFPRFPAKVSRLDKTFLIQEIVAKIILLHIFCTCGSRPDSNLLTARHALISHTFPYPLTDPGGVRRACLGAARVAPGVLGPPAVPPLPAGGEPRPGAQVRRLLLCLSLEQQQGGVATPGAIVQVRFLLFIAKFVRELEQVLFVLIFRYISSTLWMFFPY